MVQLLSQSGTDFISLFIVVCLWKCAILSKNCISARLFSLLVLLIFVSDFTRDHAIFGGKMWDLLIADYFSGEFQEVIDGIIRDSIYARATEREIDGVMELLSFSRFSGLSHTANSEKKVRLGCESDGNSRGRWLIWLSLMESLS